MRKILAFFLGPPVLWLTIKWVGVYQIAVKKYFKYGMDFVIINPRFLEIFSSMEIGDRVFINSGATIMAHAPIKIENDVMMGPNVCLLSVGHDPNLSGMEARESRILKEIIVKSGVWIGAGSIVLPGVTIGENSVIGAGSVVSKDIPPNVIAVGNPCRPIKLKPLQ